MSKCKPGKMKSDEIVVLNIKDIKKDQSLKSRQDRPEENYTKK